MASDRATKAVARKMRSEGLLNREIAQRLRAPLATVCSWTCGVLPRGTPAPSPQKIQAMRVLEQMYKEGKSIPSIAATTGVPATTLYDWRRQLKLPRNSRSLYVTPAMREQVGRQFSRDREGTLKAEAIRLYLAEHAAPEIARRFNLTSQTIYGWLKSAGISPRHSPTIATRQKLRAANLGSRRWNWKGGVTKERVRLRVSLDMKCAREACFKRDNYTCRSCRQHGGKLNAHHVWPFHRFPEWRYEVWNLVTLCKSCHDAFHNAAGGAVHFVIGPFFSEACRCKNVSGAQYQTT